MMIDDEELRIIFKTASEDHLQHLEAGLLELEKNPHNREQLENLLREAHSLKGDANMLGVKDIGTLAHHIEDVLGVVKRGEISYSLEISDRLYQGLDAIRRLVHEAVTGEAAGVDVFRVLANLMEATSQGPQPEPTVSLTVSGADSISEAPDAIETVELELTAPGSILEVEASSLEPTDPEVTIVPALEVLPTLAGSEILAAPTTAIHPANPLEFVPVTSEAITLESNGKPVPTNGHSGTHLTTQSESLSDAMMLGGSKVEPANSYRIETIRVETKKLDTLMTQAGELTVTKIRIAHHLNDVEEAATLWEDWSRDVFVNRFALNNLERNLHDGKLKQIQGFYHRLEERLERMGALINRLRSATYEDNARLDTVTNQLEEGIRTLRLLPLSTIFSLLPRMVRDLARQQGKLIDLVVEGGETRADKHILEEMKDPLMHMIRNAIDHGIEPPDEREHLGKPRTATIRLRGYQTATNIVIEIADDGRGLDSDRIKQTALKRGICRVEELATLSSAQIQSLIFAPGFSTRTMVTEVSGRGVGLDVVRTNVDRLKGTIQVDSQPGMGCTFRIQLGTTLATAHVLIVAVGDISYAIPVESVQTTLLVQQHEIFAIEGCETIVLDQQPVSVVHLANLLELPIATLSGSQSHSASKLLPCIVIKIGDERLGLLVDALLDEQDVVLKPQSRLLKRVRNISGATILGTGEVCMVLNPQDLMKSVRKRSTAPMVGPSKRELPKHKQAILLVEDSITIRTQEKRILESAGYEVVTAVDGVDGFNKLKTRAFDAIVSDIQMPNLDGLALTTKIRQHKEYKELPIILVTSLASEEDKNRGADAGANAYIAKGTFDQKVLLDTLRRLV